MRYQEVNLKIKTLETERSNLLRRLSRDKNKNHGYYPFYAAEVNKKASEKLNEIIQLQDLQSQLNG